MKQRIAKRNFCLLMVLLLVATVTGCYQKPNNSQNAEPITEGQARPINISYAYCFFGDDYIPNSLWQQMDQFGKNEWIERSVPVTETYTQIPEPENNAKGSDPLSVVLPDLDLTQYSGAYHWTDQETGLEVTAYYRVVGGMLTDELVKVYIDAAGNISQYETVNLGKYDALGLDEKQMAGVGSTLTSRARRLLNGIIFEYYAPTPCHAPADCILVSAQTTSNYILFTDKKGRVIVGTRASLDLDSDIRQVVKQVDLYAVID